MAEKSGKQDKDSRQEKHRQTALENVLKQIEKQYGKGAIMQLGADFQVDVSGMSTGSFALDLALGGRGMPRGRVIELFGPEASGKTTVALHTIASAQANGGVAAFIDAEHALDPEWAKRLGVNLDTLLVTQPDSGEQALEICDLLVCSGAVDIIVIDSVAALVPQNELNGEMGDVHVALQARLMSQALRKLSASISKTNTCVVFLNQIRLKIGVMFGNPQTTPGGLALKFYSSVRIDLRRVAAVKSGDVVVGSRTRAKVVKNKIAPPFRTGEFDIMFDSGISRAGDILDLAIENDIINKTGAWFSYGDIKIGQGRETARKFITDNPDLSEEIEHKILVAKGVIVPEDASEKEDEQALVGEKSGGEGR